MASEESGSCLPVFVRRRTGAKADPVSKAQQGGAGTIKLATLRDERNQAACWDLPRNYWWIAHFACSRKPLAHLKLTTRNCAVHLQAGNTFRSARAPFSVWAVAPLRRIRDGSHSSHHTEARELCQLSQAEGTGRTSPNDRYALNLRGVLHDVSSLALDKAKWCLLWWRQRLACRPCSLLADILQDPDSIRQV